MAMASSPLTASGRKAALITWKKQFQEGADFDNWGQPVEATDVYELLLKDIGEEVRTSYHDFSSSDEVILRKVLSAIEQRYSFLQSPDESRSCALDVSEMKKIATAFSKWTEGSPLPELAGITLPKLQTMDNLPRQSSEMEVEDDDDDDDDFGRQDGAALQNLVAKPSLGPGKTLLSIRIEKIGLKDAPQHIDPFFRVLVKDTTGRDIATTQVSPMATHRTDLYLHFGVECYIDTAIEDMPDDAAIFFELKHYKNKKKKYSTKCFSLLEKDEIQAGETCLELYKKPMNFKRKKLRLLTVKPLYLHLELLLSRC